MEAEASVKEIVIELRVLEVKVVRSDPIWSIFWR